MDNFFFFFKVSEFLCKYVALLTVANSQLLWECGMQGFVFYLRNISTHPAITGLRHLEETEKKLK